jgi:hypothetical protein
MRSTGGLLGYHGRAVEQEQVRHDRYGYGPFDAANLFGDLMLAQAHDPLERVCVRVLQHTQQQGRGIELCQYGSAATDERGAVERGAWRPCALSAGTTGLVAVQAALLWLLAGGG